MRTASRVAITAMAATTRSLVLTILFSFFFVPPLCFLFLCGDPTCSQLIHQRNKESTEDAQSFLSHFHTRKLQKLFQIKRSDRMPACMNMECERFHDWL